MGLVIPDYGLLFWMALTFLIVLFILKKFAWKPILSSLKEREDSIEEALESAQKAREEMGKLHADNEKILAEARNERNEMLKEAKEVKQNIINEAKNVAAQEAEKMLETARQFIETEKEAAVNDMKESIASFSIQIAEKILRKQLDDPSKQKDLIDQYLKDIKLN
ncbi:MAG: ATP synthase F0 subunit B [Bacteroidetes bacterium 4572_117]|nr:MAG: ATP synthase F0 subunit B [Bacteroidetes bacterium 4572_117]